MKREKQFFQPPLYEDLQTSNLQSLRILLMAMFIAMGGSQCFAQRILWTKTDSPGNGRGQAKAITSDETYLYIAGFSYIGDDHVWAIQARDKTSGNIFWTQLDPDPPGFSGAALAITCDDANIYVAGYNQSPDLDYQWKVQARDKTNGATLWTRTRDPSDNSEQATAIAIDEEYVYVAVDPLDYNEWRILKLDKVSGFDDWIQAENVDGICSSIAVDEESIYLAGSGGEAWRIQARGKLWGFADWTQFEHFSVGWGAAKAIALDGGYIYIAGYDRTPGDNFQWRIQRRNKWDGSVNWTKTENPSIFEDEALAIAVGDRYIYVAGSQSFPDERWRIQVREKSDGLVVWTAEENPSHSHDRPQGITSDDQYIYIAGYDSSQGGYQWRIQKREICQGSSILYVDVDVVGGNGSSWTDAFNCLQDALAVEGCVEEIRVAQGVYTPDQGAWVTPHDRTATFRIRSGLSIKGGYAGFGHPDPDRRDTEMYETILSGDLLGNDNVSIGDASLLDAPSRADNSNHVVTGSNTDLTAILDGFTIESGRADEDGGGMFTEDGSPTIRNCTFRLNSAGHAGGGMHNWRSSPIVENCTFVDNYAIQSGGLYSGVVTTLTGNWTVLVTGCTFKDNQGESGGGLLNWGKCNIEITDCTFYHNSAGEGAGICSANQTGEIKVTRCRFIDNSSRLNGGAAILRGEGEAILCDCRFINNKAQTGGGIMIEKGHNAVISCWFESNEVTVDGGGAYVDGGEYDFVSCQFLQNTARKNGGGICTDDCSISLVNCALLGSNSAYQGGGLAIRNSDTEIINCTIIGNSSTRISESQSHGLWSDGPTLTIANSIVWDDDGPAIVLRQFPIAIDFSCVPDEYLVYGLWNISSDPKTYESGGLMPGSACIDAGNDALVPPDTYNLDNDVDIYEPLPYDVLGNPRFVDDPATPNGAGGIVDMGAFEYQPENPGSG